MSRVLTGFDAVQWYPTPSDAEEMLDADGIPKRKRPLFAAPTRSPPLAGTAALIVLSSSEVSRVVRSTHSQ